MSYLGNYLGSAGSSSGAVGTQLVALPIDLIVEGEVDDKRVELFVGDRLPTLTFRLVNAHGDPIADLTDWEPSITISDGTTGAEGAGAASIAYGPGALIEYALHADDVDAAATYFVFVTATNGDGKALTGGPVKLIVQEKA
jgi:hypothetical protein